MKGFFMIIVLLTNLISLVINNYAYANEQIDLQQYDSILILKSKDSSYYNQTIHSINNLVSNKLTITTKNTKQKPQINDAKLIITLGISAANYAREHFPHTTKIITFINAKQSSSLKLKNNEIHLLIELPTEKYIQFAKQTLPEKRLGVLYQKNITKLSKLFDKNLYIVELAQSSKIISATRDIISSADALVALPNKEIFNRHSLKGILLSTYQNNTPIISYSPAHVKAGAIAAIFASPVNLGEHAADIIQSMLSKQSYHSKQHYAKHYSIKINHRVAQSLGLTLKSAESLSIKMKEEITIDR